MKNVIGLFTILMLVTFTTVARPKGKVKIIALKSHSVYFKVDKSFIGGSVEVYDANQNLLESEELPHTHTMVFFHEKPSGKYFIKVKKGEKTIEFGYVHI
jgi:hypothetical protein